MPSIGKACHELRIPDVNATWRVVYCVRDEVVLVLEIFSKKTPQTPQRVITECKARLKAYQKALGEQR